MSIQPRFLMVSAVSIWILCACKPTAPSNSAASNAAAAATVNGTAITERQVEIVANQAAAHGQQNTPELRKDIIDNLSMQVILSQEATKKGLDKTPEVSDQIDLSKQSILAQAFIQDYLKNNPVSDDMLKAEYEKIKGQISGNEYKARHILVETEGEAKDIIAKLRKNPKAFESLAKERSIDQGSKASGGELGWFDPSGMVPEFGAALATLKKGEFTQEPVKSKFGYHVVLLEDSRPKTIPPFEQVKSALLQKVQQQKLKQLLDDLKAKAKIEITQSQSSAAGPSAQENKPNESGK